MTYLVEQLTEAGKARYAARLPLRPEDIEAFARVPTFERAVKAAAGIPHDRYFEPCIVEQEEAHEDQHLVEPASGRSVRPLHTADR